MIKKILEKLNSKRKPNPNEACATKLNLVLGGYYLSKEADGKIYVSKLLCIAVEAVHYLLCLTPLENTPTLDEAKKLSYTHVPQDVGAIEGWNEKHTYLGWSNTTDSEVDGLRIYMSAANYEKEVIDKYVKMCRSSNGETSTWQLYKLLNGKVYCLPEKLDLVFTISPSAKVMNEALFSFDASKIVLFNTISEVFSSGEQIAGNGGVFKIKKISNYYSLLAGGKEQLVSINVVPSFVNKNVEHDMANYVSSNKLVCTNVRMLGFTSYPADSNVKYERKITLTDQCALAKIEVFDPYLLKNITNLLNQRDTINLDLVRVALMAIISTNENTQGQQSEIKATYVSEGVVNFNGFLLNLYPKLLKNTPVQDKILILKVARIDIVDAHI